MCANILKNNKTCDQKRADGTYRNLRVIKGRVRGEVRCKRSLTGRRHIVVDGLRNNFNTLLNTGRSKIIPDLYEK